MASVTQVWGHSGSGANRRQNTMNSNRHPLSTRLASLAVTTASFTLTATASDWYVAPGGTGNGTSPSDRGDLMDVLYNGQIARSYDSCNFKNDRLPCAPHVRHEDDE